MTEYNCILQRKVDNKEIMATEIDGEFYDEHGVKLVKSSFRVLDRKADYDGIDELEQNGNTVWMICCILIVIAAVVYLAP